MREYIYFLNPSYNKDRIESNKETKPKYIRIRGRKVFFGTGKKKYWVGLMRASREANEY